jgi:hypothetical protein
MESNAVNLPQEDDMYSATVGKIAGLVAEITTKEELKELNTILRARWNVLVTASAALTAAKFHVGQTVKFSSKRGLLVGKVVSFNTKTVGVVVPLGAGEQRWRVAPAMLMNADECEFDSFKKRVSANEAAPMFGFPNAAVRGNAEARAEARVERRIS